MKYLLSFLVLVLCLIIFTTERTSPNQTPVEIKVVTDKLCSDYNRLLYDRLFYQETFYKVFYFRPQESLEVTAEIASAISKKAQKYKLDPDVIISLIRIESNFKPYVVSSAGAIGLMQVMPLWSKYESLCRDMDLYNIDQNIDCGIQVYLFYLKMYRNNINLALSAYNRGQYLVDLDLANGTPVPRTYLNNFNLMYKQLVVLSSYSIFKDVLLASREYECDSQPSECF